MSLKDKIRKRVWMLALNRAQRRWQNWHVSFPTMPASTSLVREVITNGVGYTPVLHSCQFKQQCWSGKVQPNCGCLWILDHPSQFSFWSSSTGWLTSSELLGLLDWLSQGWEQSQWPSTSSAAHLPKWVEEKFIWDLKMWQQGRGEVSLGLARDGYQQPSPAQHGLQKRWIWTRTSAFFS